MKPKDYEAKFPLSRPRKPPKHKTSLKFQMWILTYLGIEEAKETELLEMLKSLSRLGRFLK
jgi:hypothetical protein